MNMTTLRAKRNISGNIALVIFLAFLVTLTLGVCPGSAMAVVDRDISVTGTSGLGTSGSPATVSTNSLNSLQLTVQITPLTQTDFGSVILQIYHNGSLVVGTSVYVSDIYAANGATVYGSGYQFVYSWTGLSLDYGTNTGYTLVKVDSGTAKTVYLTVEGPARSGSGGGGGGGNVTSPATSTTTTTTTVSDGNMQAGGTTAVGTNASGAGTATLTVDGTSVVSQLNNANVTQVEFVVPTTVTSNGAQIAVAQAAVAVPADTLASIFAADKPVEMQLGNVTLGLPPGSIDLAAFAAQGVTLSFNVTKAEEGSTPAPGTAAYMIAGQVYHISIRAEKDGVDVGGISSLSQPITLTLPYTQTGDAGIFRLNETTNVWEPMGGTVDPATGTISVTRTSLSTYAVMTYTSVFNDTKGHWAKDAINQLTARNAISGYPDGTFKPDQSISRAEFAVILVKAFGLPAQSGKVFDDTVSHWAKDYIATAAANGIVNGYDEKTFGPDDLINREQMAVMVANAAKLSTVSGSKTFTDSDQISAWAKAAVTAAGDKNIISGYPDNSFKPQANASRAEATTVIVNALK